MPPWIFCSSAPAVSGHSWQGRSRSSGPQRSTSANTPRALDEEHLCCVYLRDAAGKALNALGTHRANLPPTDVDLVRRSMGLNIEELVACLKQLLGVKVQSPAWSSLLRVHLRCRLCTLFQQLNKMSSIGGVGELQLRASKTKTSS